MRKKSLLYLFLLVLFLFSLGIVYATREEVLACYNGGGLQKAYEEYVKSYNKMMAVKDEYGVESDEMLEAFKDYAEKSSYYKKLKEGRIAPDCSEYSFDDEDDDQDDENNNIAEPWDEIERQIAIKRKILEVMGNDRDLKLRIYNDILSHMRGKGSKEEAIEELSNAEEEYKKAKEEYHKLYNEIITDELKLGQMQRELREKEKIDEIGEQNDIVDYFNNVFKPIYLENMPRWIFEKFTKHRSLIDEYHGDGAPFYQKNSPDIVYGTGWGTCGDTADAVIEKGLENCDDFYPLPVTADGFNPPAKIMQMLHLPYDWISQNHIAVLNVPKEIVKENVEKQKVLLDENIAKMAKLVDRYDGEEGESDKVKRWRSTLSEYRAARSKLENFDEEYKKDSYSFINPTKDATFVVKPSVNNNIIKLGSMNDWTVVDPYNGEVFSWYDWSKKYNGVFEFHDISSWEQVDDRDPAQVYDYGPAKGEGMLK